MVNDGAEILMQVSVPKLTFMLPDPEKPDSEVTPGSPQERDKHGLREVGKLVEDKEMK